MTTDYPAYIQTLASRYGKWIFLSCLLVSLLAFAIVRVGTPKFKATMRIYTDYRADRGLVGSLQNGISLSPLSALDEDTFLNKQLELVRTREVYARSQARLEPRFATSETKESSKLGNALKSIKRLVFGDEYSDLLEKIAEPDFSKYNKKLEAYIELESRSLVITVSDKNPDYAKAIAVAIAESLLHLDQQSKYIEQQAKRDILAKKLTAARRSLDLIGSKITEMLTKESHSEHPDYIAAIIQNYLDSTQKIAEISVTIAGLRSTEKAYSALNDQLEKTYEKHVTSGSENDLEILGKEIATYHLAIAESGAAPHVVDSILKKVGVLEDTLKRKFSKNQPYLLGSTIQQLLAEAKKSESVAGIELLAQKEQLDLLQSQQEKLRKQFTELPQLHLKYQKMQLQFTQESAVLEKLIAEYIAAELSADVPVKRLTFIDQPAVKIGLLANKPVQLLTLTLLFSLLTTLGFALFVNLSGLIISVTQLRTIKNAKFLGSLAKIPTSTELPPKSFARRLAAENPTFRLASNIQRQFRDTQKGTTKILITSSSSGSGKSCSVASCALTLAKLGMSVMVVDFDIRAQTRNVSDYFMLGEFRRITSESLKVISPESRIVQYFSMKKVNPELDEVDASETINYLNLLTTKLEAIGFDYVLFDGPPIGFAETSNLTSRMDLVALCVPEGALTLKSLNSAIDVMFENCSSNTVLGLIMTLTQVQANLSLDHIELTNNYYNYRNRDRFTKKAG